MPKLHYKITFSPVLSRTSLKLSFLEKELGRSKFPRFLSNYEELIELSMQVTSKSVVEYNLAEPNSENDYKSLVKRIWDTASEKSCSVRRQWRDFKERRGMFEVRKTDTQ